jgi:hypothetical protein
VAEQLLWEVVPDRKSLPPILRNILRIPTLRLHLVDGQLVFDGARVYDARPPEVGAKPVYRERPVRRRTEPLPLDQISSVAVYPVRTAYRHSHERAPDHVVVDATRYDRHRVVAAYTRYHRTTPEQERGLAEAVRSVLADRMVPPEHVTDPFLGLDADRLAEWSRPA